MNKSSGNKVHFNATGLATEESGVLSGLLSVMPPPDFEVVLEEEEVELSQVRASSWELGLGPGKAKLQWSRLSQACSPEEKAREKPCIPGPQDSEGLTCECVDQA